MVMTEKPNVYVPTPMGVLQHYFGFASFRGFQEEVIQTLLDKEDCLVIMPTGGGKSLCYQIPALLSGGTAIVVSPLIALMEDQVLALRLRGIQAAFYNSSQTEEEARRVLASLHRHELDLLYVAPERLVSAGFMERLDTCPVALFAIDEAHCISEWGHDFRPEYNMLGCLKERFPKIPIIALTATADKQTRQDIQQKLRISAREFIASFNRPNIFYEVLRKQKPIAQLEAFLKTRPGQSGIIYCNARQRCEELAAQLAALGYQALAYHAGMPHSQRRQVHQQFLADTAKIIVATIAFGMGIDKANVRFVVHYDLPKSLENYYQETGRAGRDGDKAHALLLYSPEDGARLKRFLVEDNPLKNSRELTKLYTMLAFADSAHCRRDRLLQYFGEETHTHCGQCDVCLYPPTRIDVTNEARQFLSCVYRLGQRYGLTHVIEVLRGSQHHKIMEQQHQKLSTYGIGQHKPASFWKHLAYQLILADYCYQDSEAYLAIKLLNKALPLLKGEESFFMSDIPEKIGMKAHRSSTGPTTLCTEAQKHFDALRYWRNSIAKIENRPAYQIFHDQTLQELAQLRPKNKLALQNIKGIGPQKLERYGAELLEMFSTEPT